MHALPLAFRPNLREDHLMEEAFVLTRKEAEALVEGLRGDAGWRRPWKCCGGPHTSYPRGNPHAHAASCPVRDLHNALDPRGSLSERLAAPPEASDEQAAAADGERGLPERQRYGFEACAAPQPGGEAGSYCRKPKHHTGAHIYL
jgi:hypothetical protein